eukprot:7302907-Prymnesium_polylepis.1
MRVVTRVATRAGQQAVGGRNGRQGVSEAGLLGAQPRQGLRRGGRPSKVRAAARRAACKGRGCGVAGAHLVHGGRVVRVATAAPFLALNHEAKAGRRAEGRRVLWGPREPRVTPSPCPCPCPCPCP